MTTKRKALLDRVKSLEEAIDRANQYLESGKHAHWHGFRPVLKAKLRQGKELPPHPDWVRNVFLPRVKKQLARAERIFETLP